MPFEPKVDVDEDCLICCEPLNHDLNFYPCPCEFQVILWFFKCEMVQSRGDSMISDFTDRRPLSVRDYVVSIEGCPKL